MVSIMYIKCEKCGKEFMGTSANILNSEHQIGHKMEYEV